MKKITPYLINKKALQFVMAALLLLGGSRMAWGQATFQWHNNDHITGQNNWGIGGNVVVEVDNGATVYIDGVIAPMNAAGQFYSVTIKVATPGGTCTIKRGSNTGILFDVYPTSNPYGPTFGAGYLIIEDGVTIDGSGVTASSPLISVSPGGRCEINGSASNPVVIANNNGATAAIHNAYALECKYTNFSYNSGTANGGAIMNHSVLGQSIQAYAKFTNCTFDHNTGLVGGAIFNTRRVECFDCEFTNNVGTNMNELGGGAIISDDNGTWVATTKLDGCYFEKNTAFNGGAVLAWGMLDCDDCTFYDNSAYNPVNLGGPGGAIYYGGSQSASQSFTLDNCTFDSNEAQFRGGAILVYKNAVSYSKCVITNTDFYNNEAMQGGAIVVHDSGAEVTFNSGKVYNNRATFLAANPTGSGQGAGVYLDGGSTFTMTGGEIGIAGTNGGNSAYYKGGGVYTRGTFNYNGGNIYYNKANDGGTLGDGGGVYVAAGDFYLKSGREIIKNSATENGGGVYISGGAMHVSGTVGGSTANKNTAVNGGGIYISGGTLDVNNGGLVSYNEATNGGGIYTNGGEMNINTGGVVSYNKATNGAGVYVNGGYSNFLKGGSINNNLNATYGGGAYINGGSLQMQSGSIHSQSATYGGGVYVNTDGMLYQIGGTIGGSGTANTATNGAGVYSKGSTMFSGGSVAYNQTTSGSGKGAGVYVDGGATTQNGIHVIEHNSVATEGAGVYVNDGDFNMTADGGYVAHYVRNHSATSGAGVYVAANGTFNLSGGYVGQTSAPNAATNGGGVYLNGGTFNMTGGNIVYNTASQDGAGVYINNGTMSYEGAGAIEHNTATRNGGGVYVAGTNAVLNMKNTKIQSNTAVNGGGVYVNTRGTFTMWGTDTSHACELVSNTVTSGNGGGLYQKGTTTVTGLIHINNNTGNRASNNAYLDQSGTVKYLYIGENGLLCGSDIRIKNNADIEIARGTGANAVSNAQYAYRNKFFDSDSGKQVYTTSTGGFNASSASLYLYAANTSSIFYNLSASSPTDYEIANGYITKVKTIAGLAYLAYDVNVMGVDYQNHTVTLENDVTLPSGRDWEPIGYRTDCDIRPFKGTFDGQFHVIYGIKSDIGYLDAGLFGFAQGATIKNVLMDSNSGCTAAENLGGIVGFFDGGTLSQCEVRCTLTANSGSDCYTGGLIGKADNSVTVHSSYAIPTFTGSGNSGGLIGNSRARLFNCFVKTTTATYAFAVTNRLFIENCYVRGMGALLGSGTLVDFCYADHPLTSGSNNKDGVFGATSLINGKYGFNPVDQQITGGDANFVVNGGLGNNGRPGGLLATLNKYVDALNRAGSYTAWTRTMGSSINDDYPVLMFKGAVCVGSKDGEFLDYATDLNTMIQAYNNVLGGGDIYLYDVTSEVNQNTNSDVRVYINENIGVLQATGNRINARTGVTLDNSSSGFMAYDWHMFSSSLTAAPMGLVYRSGVGDSYYVKNNYSTLLANGIPSTVFDDPNNMDPTRTEWSTSNIGYFPTNSPYGTWRGTADPTGSFDFYCYSEPYVHWINFKREGTPSFYDHWHMDADANGNHQNIPYENETTMEQGKGYMVALSKTSMLMADGVLNNGDASGNVTRNVTATNVSNILSYENNLKGVNLIGNPYHSYLKFDEFYNQNGINTYYVVDADAKKYVAYTVGQTAPEAPAKIHPHQGFFVMVNNSGSVTFTRRMRDTKGGAFRDDENPQYPLVNLNVADAQGRNDYATIELERPEAGGGEKAKGLHTGDASVWFHLDNIDWQTAFTVPGLHEAPVRFKAYADGVFTMTWEVLNTSFSYMHLIDNKTGMDIDCLRQSEYRFEGSTEDYLSRFRLVFEFTGVEEDEEAVESENFAFMMGDELVVNGGGVLQVFDLNGRCVYATELYDTQSMVSLPKMTAGIYILRLTGNHSTRTQKMVIR